MRPYHFDFEQERWRRGAVIIAFERAARDGWKLRRPARRGPAAPRKAAALLHKAAALIRVWRRRAREREQLARLSPHLLRDIGITPVEARHEAGKPFWRP